MKKESALVFIGSLLAFVLSTGWVFAGDPVPLEDANAGESRSDSNDMGLQSVLSKLVLTGGISGGYFFTSNSGEDIPDSEFLLSNLLVEISAMDEAFPIGFATGFGGTSTPSVLGTLENSNTLSIEYAYLTLNPVTNIGLEVGLLMPTPVLKKPTPMPTKIFSSERWRPSSRTMPMSMPTRLLRMRTETGKTGESVWRWRRASFFKRKDF